MNIRRFVFSACLTALPGAVFAQGLTPATLLKQPTDAWPTYNGDYSGRRFSPLTQINSSNVHTLSLAWATRFSAGGPGGRGGAGACPRRRRDSNQVDAADGERHPLFLLAQSMSGPRMRAPAASCGTINTRRTRAARSAIAASACTATGCSSKRPTATWSAWTPAPARSAGRCASPTRSWTTPRRWRRWWSAITFWWASAAIIWTIRASWNRAIRRTGALQWKWWTTPRKGEPGIETWPDEHAAAHGTGMAWIPGTYDPELNLYIVGTGNPNPVMAEKSRKGDNLYTCSIVALNPDTGKLVWYFQPSPHDTHDWDAVETPVIFDGTIDGQPRKLVAQASRNGYFFVLDRATGKRIVTAPMLDSLNWAKGLDAKGQPIPDPAKYPTTDGVLVSPSAGGATNWQAPSFDPETGLLYVGTSRTYSMYYLTDTDDHPVGWGGLDTGVGSDGNALLAIDYQTGKDRLETRLAQRQRRHAHPDHGRQAAVHQQWVEPDRLSSGEREDSVACGPDGESERWADHLPAGRQAVCSGGRGRQPVRVHRESAARCRRWAQRPCVRTPLEVSLTADDQQKNVRATGGRRNRPGRRLPIVRRGASERSRFRSASSAWAARGHRASKSSCDSPTWSRLPSAISIGRTSMRPSATVEKAQGHKPDSYHDFRKLLERKDLDAVMVATPDHWHALPAIHACQAGKDVFVEKPLAYSIGEGRAMVDRRAEAQAHHPDGQPHTQRSPHLPARRRGDPLRRAGPDPSRRLFAGHRQHAPGQGRRFRASARTRLRVLARARAETPVQSAALAFHLSLFLGLLGRRPDRFLVPLHRRRPLGTGPEGAQERHRQRAAAGASTTPAKLPTRSRWSPNTRT